VYVHRIKHAVGGKIAVGMPVAQHPSEIRSELPLPDSRERDKILSFRKIGILDAGAIGNANKKEQSTPKPGKDFFYN
jgi:hypothetical protein